MINLIAAVDLNNALGYKNQLLTHLPSDLKHFKSLTQGNFCVMGRKTYESIGKPLPNRHNIILSHNTKLDIPNAYVYNSVEDILNEYESYGNKEAELFICGGSQIYKQFLPYADRIFITVIDHEFDNVDAYFPVFDISNWKVTENIKNKSDENNPFDHYFVTFNKK